MSDRDAVSLLVTPADDDQRVLLVERNPKLRFFGGFFAFPGGTLDDEDASIPVERQECLAEVPAPIVVAAARELFEETGLWAATGGANASAEMLRQAREEMLAGRVTFGEILAQAGHRVDAAAFSAIGRMKTPPFAPVRYDTWFLRHATVHPERMAILQGELVGGSFESPEHVLDRWGLGEIPVAPPMVILLREWSRGPATAMGAIRDLCQRYASGEMHRIYFTPGILLVPLKTPTRPPATHTNTLIIGEDRLYVVDPAPSDPQEQARLFELLDRLVSEGRRLEAILLTHYHPDHVGAVRQTVDRYGLPVFAHQDTAELLPALGVSRCLNAGDELPLGRAPDGREGWTLKAFHVPGHAPGHLAFQENRYGALVVGDLVSTLSSILVDPRDGHLGTYMLSLESLLEHATGALYPGHGPPSLNGRRLLQKQLAHRAGREDQLVGALQRGERTADELVAAIYDDLPDSMMSLARRSLLSGLIKLEEEGRVVSQGRRFRLVPEPV